MHGPTCILSRENFFWPNHPSNPFLGFAVRCSAAAHAAVLTALVAGFFLTFVLAARTPPVRPFAGKI